MAQVIDDLESEKMDPRTLTELQKQDAVLAELPPDFPFPLFNGRQAVESQRKSGYKNTPRAAREIVDNALEAGATHVWVVLRRPPDAERAKRERKDAVSAIAFIDDGPGMRPDMARLALSWGGGTRFSNPTGIGRFGFGLPNASINQTRRVEVYTRTTDGAPWARVVLDITPENVPLFDLVTVAPVENDARLPDWVTEYMAQNTIEVGSGTIVVWDKPDRLSARAAGTLRPQMLDDFGVVYRYLLDRFEIIVDGVKVEKVDPLFLMPDARYHVAEEEGGAWCRFEKALTVKYSRDPVTGAQHLTLLQDASEIRAARKDSNAVVDTILVRIAGFPYGFAAERVRTGFNEAGKATYKGMPKESAPYKRMQIRKQRRGFSVVRANREIDTISNFPSLPGDKSAGLGEWPVLQSYALHWGGEVRFGPKLDEAFGIGNDKQTVSPVEDVWRVFHEAEVDFAVSQEERKQDELRSQEKARKAREEVDNPDAPNPATDAAAMADEVLGQTEPLPEDRAEEARKRFEETVRNRATKEGKPTEEVEEEEKGKAEQKRYAVRTFHAEGGPFFKPDIGNGLQRVAMINTAHPFFTAFYTILTQLGNARARQATDVLLCGLAKAELEAGTNARCFYETLREDKLSPFLKLGLKLLEQYQSQDDEQEDE